MKERWVNIIVDRKKVRRVDGALDGNGYFIMKVD